MSKLNIDRIAKLVGYGKLNETADYDFGGVEPRTHKVEMMASKPGQANLPVRNVNKQGDNPLEEEGICEPDPQFDGMGDDYITTMIDMMRSAPAMASSEANIQWLAAANAELARRATFAQLAAQAEQEAAAQAIVAPEADQVTAPVVDVCIDRMGRPEHMTVVQDGRFFVHARNEETGQLEIFPRDEWDSIVLDNDSMYDNVRVGDRVGIPQAEPETEDDDIVVLCIGEDDDMEEGFELDMPDSDHDDEEEDDWTIDDCDPEDETIAGEYGDSWARRPKVIDEGPWDENTNKEADEIENEYSKGMGKSMSVNDDDKIDEGVMDTIRQHVNPEIMSKAHSVLLKAGISDSAITNRDVNMKASGWTKLAHILSGEAMADVDAEDYCRHVLHALADRLEEGRPLDEAEQLDEFEGMGGDQRFTYTTDTLGNVNISDSMTGASLYLQGQDAQELLGQLEIYGASPEKVQSILAQYEHAMDNQVDADGEDVGLNIPMSSKIDAAGF
jgi:hypothetical protein